MQCGLCCLLISQESSEKRSKMPASQQQKINFEVLQPNNQKFGIRGLSLFGPKIWDSLPFHIKTAKT